MSIAYVDPGNLESDLQTGSKTGYVLLWLLLLTTLMGFLVQIQSAKLGVATGKHLAQHCREQYNIVPRLVLWIMAEVAIIGSDIQEVVGSAIAISLLSGGRVPLWAGVLITGADAFVLLLLERFGVRILEASFGIMIAMMGVSFGIMYWKADVPTNAVLEGFLIPRLPRKDVPTAVALVGSLIMPHNIYLHSALVQSRKAFSTTDDCKKEAILYFNIESALSLLSSIFINLYVVGVFAHGFYDMDGAPEEIGLENAGKYLGETYGHFMVVIWALGLLAAGQSSTMTGTYTGQFVMQGYLDLKIKPWVRVLFTRCVAIIPAVAVAMYFDGAGLGLDHLNQSLNLLQSIQLPFALLPLLLLTSSVDIMGEKFVNSTLTTVATSSVAFLVVAINAWGVFEAVVTQEIIMNSRILVTLVTIVVLVYLNFLLYLVYLAYGRSCKAVLQRLLDRHSAALPEEKEKLLPEAMQDMQSLPAST
ncbi:hypothetical protein CEUSTIGMA_g3806.t1 [Chlamydomonas eustigma]|uniref:Metal transporter n=1 Tax=Chlamydomonas eustigma TaxID=1157962 RepID=A0A250X0T3_9CHLO|nr:hypothetical protein CEUSTIGMA_g3806.t1 [Chlamydomonas eustigma]|eukprot:GAX76360.1 hypothetical protein CEUSTIGMA_g3806.t1 [Chlamydomonas eustigma]